MGIINRLFGREIRADDAQIVEVQMDDELKRLLGVSISEETAMNIPAVAACVNFICGKIAELPIRLYKDDLSGKAEEVTNDARLGLLNDETGDLLDPFQMKFAVVRDFLLHGSGYLFPEMRGNQFVSLRYVDKRNVQFIKNEDPIFKTARCVIGTRTFFEDEIIRICRNSRDGVTGRGIVDENREILETAYKEILFEKYLVRKGGNKKGFLQTDQRVEQAVIDDIRKKWEEFYANNESTMLVLNNGLKFVESSNTSVEMQLDESIRRNNEMICQLFGLSSRVISGTAGDDEYVTAIKTAVIPVCTAFQAALNKGFLLPSQRKQYYWQFDMKQLLKGDILKRYQAYSTALKDGWLQKDEVRYEEDYEPYGFNFITLSLSDVLLDMDNRVLYTPNTNQAVRLGEGGISLGTQTPDTGQKNVDNGGESGIIEERSNDGSHYKKGEHGHFAGSTPYASGGSSGSSGGGSLNENSKKPLTKITDDAIEKVPLVSIAGYSDEQCKTIREQHRELLRYSRDNNDNKEVAFVFDGNLSNRKEFKGTDDKLDFGSSLYGKDLFVMHNHPRNSSYSMNDVVEFITNDSIKTLTIVKNNGRIETLTKINSCDKVKMITDLGRIKKKNVKTGSDKELDKTVKDFLTKNVKGGIFEWQN